MNPRGWLMLLLELTLDTPEENLALDEALLMAAEDGNGPSELLRIWEPRQQFVVLGSSSRFETEANVAACEAAGVPIFRRASGGAAILTGPGCLMYAVLLGYDRCPHLASIEQAHRHVLGALAAAIGQYVPGVAHAGISDLALAGRKFSGNSLRCKRRHLVYHGTLLYDFPVSEIRRFLGTPLRQPEYRASRAHDEFVTNLPLDRATLAQAVREAFDADEAMRDWPHELTARLVEEKYSRAEWNRRL